MCIGTLYALLPRVHTCLGSVYVYPELIGLSPSWFSRSFPLSLDMWFAIKQQYRARQRTAFIPQHFRQRGACPKRLIDDRLELTVLSVTKIDYAHKPFSVAFQLPSEYLLFF